MAARVGSNGSCGAWLAASIVSDAVERGRAGWAMSARDLPGRPHLPQHGRPLGAVSHRSRGPAVSAPVRSFPGSQFPAEAYDQFAAQLVPRWTTTDAAQTAAYQALLARTGPAVVVAHAQGALFAFRAALANPESECGRWC